MPDDNNWFAHRFVKDSKTTFRVDHETTHADEPEYVERRPSSGDGFASVAAAEKKFLTWAVSDDYNWYIHRIGAAASSGRSYLIDHKSSGGTTTCPSSGGYTTLKALATDLRLSKLDDITSDSTCPKDDSTSDSACPT